MRRRHPLTIRRREEETSREIRAIEKMLLEISSDLAIDPIVSVDPQFYYDADSDNPTRFLELRLGHRTSVRIGLERRRLAAGAWGLGWNIFANGSSVEEGEISAPQVGFMRPTLSDLLGRYLHVRDTLRDQ
jgi:hypothetical protein